MEYRELVNEITRLVILELERQETAVSAGSAGRNRKVVIPVDPEMTDFAPLTSVLSKEPPGASFYMMVAPSEMADTVKASTVGLNCGHMWDVPRKAYADVVREASRVVIPFVSVTSLQKMANLIGDEPLPGIFLQALLSGVPVAVCTDYIHQLKFRDNAVPKKIISMISSSLSTLEEMGVSLIQLAEMTRIEEARLPVSSPEGLKNVITNEDIITAANQGTKTLNFPRGTIVTPLAWETAENMDIRINLV